MTDATTDTNVPAPKAGKGKLILMLVLCIAGAGLGFFATYTGMILGTDKDHNTAESHAALEDLSDIAFVPVDPIIVTLRPGSTNKHMSFRAELEVSSAHKEDVEHLLPRITDVMNGYLRALETEDFESPAIIIRLRSQLLRRVQVVAGEDRINDLLVMEFVLN